MKKLFILPLSLVLVFSSCKKDSSKSETQKTNILLNDNNLTTSKIRQTNSGITLTATFDPKTGVVKVSPDKKNQIFVFVSYKSYKDVNGSYVLNSSINYGTHVGSFVVSNYASIPVGTKHKLNLEARTPNGGYFNFVFEENKK